MGGRREIGEPGLLERPGVAGRSYVVRIIYEESMQGSRRRHSHELQVKASCPEEAETLARRHFVWAERNSGVSWPRTIVRIDVSKPQ